MAYKLLEFLTHDEQLRWLDAMGAHTTQLLVIDADELHASYPGHVARGLERALWSAAETALDRDALLCIAGIDRLLAGVGSAAETADIARVFANFKKLLAAPTAPAVASVEPTPAPPVCRLSVVALCSAGSSLHPLARACFTPGISADFAGPAATTTTPTRLSDCCSQVLASIRASDARASLAVSQDRGAEVADVQLTFGLNLLSAHLQVIAQHTADIVTALQELGDAFSTEDGTGAGGISVPAIVSRLVQSFQVPQQAGNWQQSARHIAAAGPALPAVHDILDFRSSPAEANASALEGATAARSRQRRAGAPVPRASVSTTATWSAIAGQDAAKLALQQLVTWPRVRRHAFTRLGFRAPCGILLHGPPGTGKTMLARAAASDIAARFFPVSLPSIIKGGIGEGERVLSAVFDAALASAPSVIFFDELQAAFPARPTDSSGEGGGTMLGSMLTSQLLLLMDGVRAMADKQDAPAVVVIGATNVPQALDPALLRPGRFDKLVHVSLPSAADRRALLTRLITAAHTELVSMTADELAADIASRTDGFSGAELSNLHRSAVALAVKAALATGADPCTSPVSEREWQQALELHA